MTFWTISRSKSVIAVLSLLAFYALQQNTINAAELNLVENQFPVGLGLYLDILEDPSTELTFEEIRNNDLAWKRSSQSIPTLGFSASNFWFRVTLSGEFPTDTLMLVLDAPTIDRIEFYTKANDSDLQTHLAGDTVPLSQHAIASRKPAIPIATSNATSEVELWFKVNSQSGIELPLTLNTSQRLLEQQQSELAFLGAFFVLFCLSFIACAIAFFIIRERQSLGYSLFFGSSIVFFLTLTGIGKIWFWPEATELNNRFSYASGTLLLFSISLLGQTLNAESKFRDLALIVLRFTGFIMLLSTLYFLLLPFDLISGSNILTVLGIGLFVVGIVLTLAVISAKQGSRVAIYIVATWSLLILSYGSLVSYKFGLIEKGATSALVAETLVGLAAIALLISLAEFIKIKNEEFVESRLETKAKSDFLRNVSKEFLTPVHLILANSKRLNKARGQNAEATALQCTQTVLTQSEHLHNLINDLLEMAEIESESFEPEFELVEITQFLSDIHNTMLPSASEKDLEFETQFSSANLLVQTDKARLQHVLINLITNAIKFTEKGKITIGFKAVYFKSRLGVEISVSDTGSGMSSEFKTKIFEDFSHNDDYSEINPTNTGLGMVIVKRIVEKLGGDIHFESEQGSGSEFFVKLPLRNSKT